MAASDDKPIISEMKELDFEKVLFKVPCNVGTSGRIVYLCYDARDYMFFHFPPVRVPFNIKQTPWGAWNLSLEFDEARKRQSRFLKTMRDIDEFMIASIVKYSPTWFGRQYTEEEARNCYKSTVREQPPYKPKISPKFIFSSDKELKTNIYNKDNEPLDLEGRTLGDIFTRGSMVMGVLQVSGLWISKNNDVSVILRILQVKVNEAADDEATDAIPPAPKRLRADQMAQLFSNTEDDMMTVVSKL